MKDLDLSVYSPVIVGAMGGSGTRIVSRFLQSLGFYMGRDLNESDDTMNFVEFYDTWINPYYSRNIIKFDIGLMKRDFVRCFLSYLDGCSSSTDIGWKNHRSIHVLDFFNELFPRMKFIHVIRDGRDVAYSKTQVQVDRHAKAFLGMHERCSRQLASAKVWNLTNRLAYDYGTKNMSRRYFWIKYEDLCRSPVSCLRKIARFVGKKVQPMVLNTYAAEIREFLSERSTIGRFIREDPSEVSHIEEEVREGLCKFGYVR